MIEIGSGIGKEGFACCEVFAILEVIFLFRVIVLLVEHFFNLNINHTPIIRLISSTLTHQLHLDSLFRSFRGKMSHLNILRSGFIFAQNQQLLITKILSVWLFLFLSFVFFISFCLSFAFFMLLLVSIIDIKAE